MDTFTVWGVGVKILFPPYLKSSTFIHTETGKGGPVKDRPPIAAGFLWVNLLESLETDRARWSWLSQ